MNVTRLMNIAVLAAGLSISSAAFAADEAKPVGITAEKMSITVKHGGADVEIKRNQDNKAVVSEDFAKTSRPCPEKHSHCRRRAFVWRYCSKHHHFNADVQ